VLQPREGDDGASRTGATLGDARLQRDECVLARLPRAGVATAAVALAVGVAAVACEGQPLRGARRGERDLGSVGAGAGSGSGSAQVIHLLHVQLYNNYYRPGMRRARARRRAVARGGWRGLGRRGAWRSLDRPPACRLWGRPNGVRRRRRASTSAATPRAWPADEARASSAAPHTAGSASGAPHRASRPSTCLASGSNRGPARAAAARAARRRGCFPMRPCCPRQAGGEARAGRRHAAPAPLYGAAPPPAGRSTPAGSACGGSSSRQSSGGRPRSTLGTPRSGRSPAGWAAAPARGHIRRYREISGDIGRHREVPRLLEDI